jgi:hypothetical protein
MGRVGAGVNKEKMLKADVFGQRVGMLEITKLLIYIIT